MTIQEIDALNRQAMHLNEERHKRLGAQDAARKTFDAKVRQYEQRYGVTLDDTNLQEEYNREAEKVANGAKRLKEQIEAIMSGNYAQVDTTKTGASIPVVPSADNAYNMQKVQVASTQFGASPAPAPAPAPAPTGGMQSAPAPAPAPAPTGGMQSAPAPAPAPAHNHSSNAEDEDISEQPFTAPNWAQPVQNVPVVDINGTFAGMFSNKFKE